MEVVIKWEVQRDTSRFSVGVEMVILQLALQPLPEGWMKVVESLFLIQSCQEVDKCGGRNINPSVLIWYVSSTFFPLDLSLISTLCWLSTSMMSPIRGSLFKMATTSPARGFKPWSLSENNLLLEMNSRLSMMDADCAISELFSKILENSSCLSDSSNISFKNLPISTSWSTLDMKGLTSWLEFNTRVEYADYWGAYYLKYCIYD